MRQAKTTYRSATGKERRKMKKSNETNKSFDKIAVKGMASFVRGVASDSVDNRCFLFLHQPKEPANLADRLKAMESK